MGFEILDGSTVVNWSAVFVEAVFESLFGSTYVLFGAVVAFFRPLSSVYLFQSNQCLQVWWPIGTKQNQKTQNRITERTRGPTRFGKALNLIFPKLSSQNVRGFDHAMILSPIFHGLR